jgi:hypothetical protein
MKTYSISYCTDGACSRAHPCAECGAQSGRVLKDGEGVRTRMMMMDSVQHDIANTPAAKILDASPRDALGENAKAGQATLDAIKTAGDRTQAFVDHHLAKQAQRDHGLTRNGFDQSLDARWQR